MKIYKIAKSRKFKDSKGKEFYVHYQEKCLKCGKIGKEDFTYDANYVCEKCGGNFVYHDDGLDSRRTDTPVLTRSPESYQDNWSGSWDDAVKVNEGSNKLQWYKTAIEEQLDLFEENVNPVVNKEVVEEPTPEKKEKKDDNGIVYLGSKSFYGKDSVDFQIRDKYYTYVVNDPEFIYKMEIVARKYSAGKALDMTKKRAKQSGSEVFEMEKSTEYPYNLNIKREILNENN